MPTMLNNKYFANNNDNNDNDDPRIVGRSFAGWRITQVETKSPDANAKGDLFYIHHTPVIASRALALCGEAISDHAHEIASSGRAPSSQWQNSFGGTPCTELIDVEN